MKVEKKDCQVITSVVRKFPCGHFQSVVIVILNNGRKFELACKIHFDNFYQADRSGVQFIEQSNFFEIFLETYRKAPLLYPEHETIQ